MKDNIPKGYTDPANVEVLFEPSIQEMKQLEFLFLESNKDEFIKFVEQKKGKPINKAMILEWLECDILENT